MPSQNTQVERARTVKADHESDLMAYRGVVSVGVGLRERGDNMTAEVAIVVMVNHKLPVKDLQPDEMLPTHLDGVAVDVQESGEITGIQGGG